MQKTFFTLTSTVMMLVLSVIVTMAQGSCTEFLEQALEAVDTSCQGIGRNQACYGFNRVEASFLDTVAEDFFSQPSDVTDVADVATIRTAPFNRDTDEWGVAVMVLQANMPDTLPGQNVTFVLMGDTEIENAVSPEDAHQSSPGIDVMVSYPQGAAIRSGPGDNFNTIGGVVTGTIFTTDGLSADGNWLRIVWEERPAWLRRTTVTPIPEIETLPVFNDELRTPMQAFYLRTGIGQPECEEVPDNSLLVQGPEDIEIELTVNGANIALSSSGILRVLNPDSPNPQLEIIVLDGEFVVKADEFNPQDVVIRAGQRTTLCLQDGNNEGLNGQPDDLLVTCGASPPERIDTSEFIANWCSLEGIPGTLLNYDLSTCNSRTHTIQAGENLFRIAQYYCIAMDDLIAINGIIDPGAIAVGQVLTLPQDACEGTGSTRPPADALPPVSDNPVANNACSVTLISPLSDVNSGNHTFSWTGADLADVSYNLVFYNYLGERVETFQTTDTSYFLNLGQQTSTGGEFSWEVELLQNGAVLCSSGRSSTLVRLGDLNPQPRDFTASHSTCSDNGSTYETTVTWNNAPSTPVTITWEDSIGTQGSTSSGARSDSVTITTSYSFYTFTFIKVSSGGELIDLGGC